MRIEPLEPGAAAEWDAFCRAEPAAWFWHTTDWTGFMLAAKPERAGRSLAFTVREGRELLAVAPVVLEDEAFVLGGAPCWAPAVRGDLDAALADRVLRTALEHVDGLAAEHDIARAAFQMSPLAPSAFAAAAVRAGYLDVSRTSQVLDLSAGPEALLRGMSKGHRAAVKRAADRCSVTALSGPEATHAALHEFRALTEDAAGRQTRPPETYDRLAAWAQRGDALLLLAEAEGRVVGGSYLNVFDRSAYYSLAAMDRSRTHEPIGHALQWAAIEWLLANGVETYELGLQQFGPLLHDVPTDKEQAISRFKRGFGGTPRLAPAYEKWFSADAFRATFDGRAQRYAAARFG